MITIPSVLNHKSFTVFGDDEDPNLFYAFRSNPLISMQDGEPVFSGLFWTDRAMGETTAVAGLGGGWINFDTNLGITPEEEKELVAKIQTAQVQQTRRNEIVKAERERLGLISRARGESTVPEPDIPPVKEIRFGSVVYTGGTVELLEEKGGDIVPWSSAGGPASRIGNNNAAFALRLSPTGAALWYKALKEGDKAISIRYDLKFQMRLPSLEIRAWAGSFQENEINRKVERVWRNTDQGCSDADVERINVKEITEKLMEEGLMNIEVKKGSTEISDENVSQLRNLAIKMIEDKVKEILKTRIHGMTEDERKNSMIELMKEEVRSFVELRFTQRDVVEWGISPQGTIMNFLENVPDNKKEKVTKLVDLAQMEVETVTINTFVSAPWEEAPFVNSVKVNLEYPSAKEKHSVIMKKDSGADVWRFRKPENDDGVVNYTSEIFLKAISEPIILKGDPTNGDVNINIGKPGLIDLTFLLHPTLLTLTGDNDIVVVQIDLWYKDENHPDHFHEMVVIKKEDAAGVGFTRITGKLIDEPIRYKTTYFFKDGSSREMPEKKFYVSENKNVKLYAESPYQDTLDIPVELSNTPDESVKKIVVDFKYNDEENKFNAIDRLEFTQEDNWEPGKAKLVIMDKTKNKFSYQFRIISSDSIAKSPWMEGEGEALIVLSIAKVHVDPSALKIGTELTNALLTLSLGENAKKEILLTQANAEQPVLWFIPGSATGEPEFSYKLACTFPDGSKKETTGNHKGSILQLNAPAYN